MQDLPRCPWCHGHDIYLRYHDEEWGVPTHDDHKLFEMLCLEGAQAGLSWLTILNKRETYRLAFDGFDAVKMACYGDAKRAALLADPGIVRNRLKVNGFIENAKAYLKVKEGFGSFERYIWQFVGHQPIVNHWEKMGDCPATTPHTSKRPRSGAHTSPHFSHWRPTHETRMEAGHGVHRHPRFADRVLHQRRVHVARRWQRWHRHRRER